jgi:protein KRI1
LEELGVDLDADWDPEKHDQQMASLYERHAANSVDVEEENVEREDENEDEVGS